MTDREAPAVDAVLRFLEVVENDVLPKTEVAMKQGAQPSSSLQAGFGDLHNQTWSASACRSCLQRWHACNTDPVVWCHAVQSESVFCCLTWLGAISKNESLQTNVH